MTKYAEVALPVPLRQTFLYIIPDSLMPYIIPGVRVIVPFGSRSLTGVVVGIKNKQSKKGIKLKEINKVLDETPLISKDLLALTRKLSEYFYSPWGEMLNQVFPPSLFMKSRINICITSKGIRSLEKGDLTSGEKKFLEPLKKRSYSYQYLRRKYGGDHFSKNFARMEKNGLIEKRKEFPHPVKRRKEKKTPSTFQLEMDFSWERESGKILNELLPRLEEPAFFPAVIMASQENRAKIYLKLIKVALEKEKKVLVVLPEIPLAEIFQEKLKKHLITESVVFHGRLTEKARESQWMRIRSGNINVILGSRTALLAPVDYYGLIVVDQEENESFDQSDTGQLNIKKASWIKAEANSAVMVLGSSSPTVETYFQAQKKGYLYSIREKTAVPSAEIVEVKREKNVLSPRLLEKIRENVSAGQQVLLFVNRRGYASYVFCPRCRYIPKCEHCEISLTYHKRENKLVCHYCNYSQNVTGSCIKCGSGMIQNRGVGTELVAEKIRQSFPGIQVAAFDSDFMKRKRVRDKVLRDLTQRKINVLVGTRLLANQSLLPPVSLVGILFPEENLMFGDFRSGQKTYQTIRKMMEFTGSRGEGEVVIQTDQPHHYCIRSAAENNYALFYQQELEYRRLMHYPPFSVLTEVVFQGDTLRSAARESRKFVSEVQSRSNEIEVLGPSLAPLPRLKGKVRIQTVLKADKKQQLDAVLPEILKDIRSKITIKIFE